MSAISNTSPGSLTGQVSGAASGLLIDNLAVQLPGRDGGPPLRPVRAVSLAVAPGQTVGLVGESGCGKSLTALATLGLLPAGARTSGRVLVDGVDVLQADAAQLAAVRGRRLALIFQNPMTALNPFFTIGQQIAAVIHSHFGNDQAANARRLQAAIHRVQLPAGSAARYPHQMSGGQLQRAMIAMAVACEPAVLVADEPTTALDVTVQARVMALLQQLTRQGMGLLLITHDLSLVAQAASLVVVMYAGRVVESGPTDRVFAQAAHPYTAALLQTQPRLGGGQRRLQVIEGRVPPPQAVVEGCAFAGRCARASAHCRSVAPQLERVAQGADRSIECHHPWPLHIEAADACA